MSFFDSKEDVIKIELTYEGKELLSHGKFKPKYYAFYDDDILYDGLYANLTESQKSIQQRILQETAYTKPQTNYETVEKRALKYFGNKIKDINEFSLPYSIGTSDPSSEFAPAWNVNAIINEVESTTPTINKNCANNIDCEPDLLNIPQINMKQSFIKLVTGYNESLAYFIPQSIYYDPIDLINVLSIEEKNSLDTRENFVLEVFIEETEDNINHWKQLKFYKQKKDIEDNILLDEPMYDIDTMPIVAEKDTVEYWFDIRVDELAELLLDSIRPSKTNMYPDTNASPIKDC